MSFWPPVSSVSPEGGTWTWGRQRFAWVAASEWWKLTGLCKEVTCGSLQAGIIEEMLEDTFESMDDQEEMEEEAEMEIDRILFEITAGTTMRSPPCAPRWPFFLSLN